MIVPLELLLPFLVASILVTVIPGAEMALVTRQVLVGGPALAQKTIFGNLTGLLVHGVALAAARLVHRARGVLTAPRVKAWLERTTGVVLIAFGLRVAVERR